MSDATADLSLIARQQRQILAEIGSMRDDMAVLTAIAMRQGNRMSNRVRELEGAASGTPQP